MGSTKSCANEHIQRLNKHNLLHNFLYIQLRIINKLDWTLCYLHNFYRVTMMVMHLGWVDCNLGSSPGRLAATVATYCPRGGWNILNLSQPIPLCAAEVSG